jgi:hypothetical protein
MKDAGDVVRVGHDGEREGPPAGRYAAVTLGEGAECGVLVDGKVACWGQEFGGLDVSSIRGATAVAVAERRIQVRHADGGSTCFALGFGRWRDGRPQWTRQRCPAGKVRALAFGAEEACDVD